MRDGDGPTVAVFDDSTRSALYRRWLPDAIEVVTVQSIGEGRRVVDGSTAVALVRHELSESKRGAVADLLDEQSPLVRTVLTTSRHEPVADRVLDENATLCEPIDRDSLRQVVSRQVAMASYGRLLVQYYECTTRLSSREVELRGDSCDDERYQRLESRREDLAAGIKTLQKRLSAEALRSVLYEIAPPEQERVAREREPPTSGKYRPDGCRSCGRNWNVNPDGSPAGYRRLGAFVWECTDCGTLHDRSDPVNQRVARRR
ncbi:response regulator receiver protein [Halosimplex carlsbadense 2-9-1]|uniref:Response regulator receiver protein n=1 Tax=Halosimplex carlsbadense 2-9-1 TaxID=797114 RepID=M0CNU0_9EURY|nr:response regulator receiver protein [Halosimplex carlsbadense 2-9-1]